MTKWPWDQFPGSPVHQRKEPEDLSLNHGFREIDIKLEVIGWKQIPGWVNRSHPWRGSLLRDLCGAEMNFQRSSQASQSGNGGGIKLARVIMARKEWKGRFEFHPAVDHAVSSGYRWSKLALGIHVMKSQGLLPRLILIEFQTRWQVRQLQGNREWVNNQHRVW